MSLIAGLLLSLVAQTQETSVKGSLTCKSVSMTPVDVISVWDAKTEELRVVLLPVKIEPDMIPKIQMDRLMSVAMQTPSPDPKK